MACPEKGREAREEDNKEKGKRKRTKKIKCQCDKLYSRLCEVLDVFRANSLPPTHTSAPSCLATPNVYEGNCRACATSYCPPCDMSRSAKSEGPTGKARRLVRTCCVGSLPSFFVTRRPRQRGRRFCLERTHPGNPLQNKVQGRTEQPAPLAPEQC